MWQLGKHKPLAVLLGYSVFFLYGASTLVCVEGAEWSISEISVEGNDWPSSSPLSPAGATGPEPDGKWGRGPDDPGLIALKLLP